ncbi:MULTISPECIES: hypothetical protein [Vitreoscilla]|uniref:Uncharacterized protein n=1 Tax=Vitreoscilla stercoraria TaxID=61 RepID=A0ABY4EE28_VITST|nr:MULTISPECIES: hypothetical protein [Vitreoscilla]AUZ05029.1 hypothetical protein ADP71_14210 [Vitreoscilla sp. C1]UOO93650.1 hypothetical protein LVJ81_06395 [Vitreoscilla stercoraria]
MSKDTYDLIIFSAIAFCLFMAIRPKKPFKQIFQKSSKNGNFKQIVQDTFPNYIVLNRSQSIMICEPDIRNEPIELVIIRIDPTVCKNLSFKSKILIAVYPVEPTPFQMKQDFQNLKT